MRRLLPLLALATVMFPREARADDNLGVPVVRLAMGPAVFVAPVEPRFALDLTVGFLAISEPGIVFGSELGYSFDTTTTHAFNLTGAIGFGTPFVAATYNPRLLVGTVAADGALPETTVGMRNSIMLHFLADIFSFEAGHQFKTTPTGLEHDVPIMFGINPASAVFIMAALGEALR